MLVCDVSAIDKLIDMYGDNLSMHYNGEKFLLYDLRDEFVDNNRECSIYNHEDDSASLPYFVFIVKKKCIPVLLSMLFQTLDPEVDVKTMLPLCNTNSINISWGFTDDKYAIINVHWAHSFLEDPEQHKKLLSDLYEMSFKILEAKL